MQRLTKRNIKVINHDTGQQIDFPTFGKEAGEDAYNQVSNQLTSLQAQLESSIASMSEAIVTDKTLTIEDAPADAKATGDAINNLRGAVGSPLVAATAAAMIDTNKVYVYTGSEAGYINGNWYYYDGSVWISGGVYNSVAVDVDTTLTISGKASDSKSVGDTIANLKNSIQDVKAETNSGIIPLSLIPNTYISRLGAEIPYPDWSSTDFINLIPDGELHVYSANRLTYNAFYDENKVFIPDGIFTVNIGENNIAVPQSAHYCRISGNTTAIQNIVVYTDIKFLVDNFGELVPVVNELKSKSIEQKNLNSGTVATLYYTDSASWEIGSIYQSGANYDDNKNAIRTPLNSKIYLPSGMIVSSTNIFGKTLYGFQYTLDGTYVKRIGESLKKELIIDTEGYYRFVLSTAMTITSETIDNYTNNFFIGGKVIRSLYEKPIYTNHLEGKKICLSSQGYEVIKASYNLPVPADIHEDLSSRQDFDIYNNVIFQLFSNDYVALIDLDTGSIITSYHINCGHANSCQFSNEFYDETDKYPLLYCFGYTNNLVYVNRVTDSAATLIKTYKLDSAGYRFSGGLDTMNHHLVTIHYATNSSTSSENNKNYISVWDLNNVINDSSDGTLKPNLISKTEIPFHPVVQGCAFFKDVLYVVSGYYSNGYPVKLTGFYKNGDVASIIADFPTEILNSEGEGICFYKMENVYKCYFATYNLYELQFE